jgi:type IV pilus assembly protein PilM
MGFLRPNNAVGLDIDTAEIRAVELSGKVQSPKLVRFGRIPLPGGAVSEGLIANPGMVEDALRQLWSDTGFSSREVILGVSNQGVIVRFAAFPKVADKKMDKLIKFQAQEYIPYPIDSVVLDYMIVGEAKGEDEGDLLEVLLVAAKRDMLNSFIEVISAAGLQVKDIDVSSLALQQVVPLFDRQDTIAIINIANQMSSILMTENGRPRFARITPTGLEAAAKTFNCSLEQVVTITAAGQPAWQQQAISSWSAALAEEISSSLSYYQNQQMGGAIKKIFIAGRGARIDGLAERLQENLSLTVAAIDPLEGITVTNKNIGITDAALDFTLSIALARRGLGGIIL